VCHVLTSESVEVRHGGGIGVCGIESTAVSIFSKPVGPCLNYILYLCTRVSRLPRFLSQFDPAQKECS
jgi:hypothetical protein